MVKEILLGAIWCILTPIHLLIFSDWSTYGYIILQLIFVPAYLPSSWCLQDINLLLWSLLKHILTDILHLSHLHLSKLITN